MSSPEPTPAQRAHMTSSYTSFKHTASLGMLILAPILIALPPRKLDLYTFSLAGATVLSANQLAREHTGAGIWEGIRNKVGREAVREAGQREGPGRDAWVRVDRGTERVERPQGRLLEEPASAPAAASAEHKTGMSPIAGASKSDWKAERLRTEQEKLDEGEGYGSMIVDQVWEVWNWGEKKMEGAEGEDRRVVEERERERERLETEKEKEKRREVEFPRIGGKD